jgi:beta-1,4-galactosyltransferase 4
MISIIIPYRDRESHLQYLLPRLESVFESGPEDYEIIVSEQDDMNNFQISCVQNVGAKYARGDKFIFHQVDYIPSDDVSYKFNENYALLPAKRGVFLTDDLGLRDISDIPAGYKNFINEIDPNFYGGVLCMTKNQFIKINGFNHLYKGWGNEDEDIRERLKYYNIPVKRNEVGTFWILNHKDNCPSPGDTKWTDFYAGRQMLLNFSDYLNFGISNFDFTSVEISNVIPEIKNLRWIKSTNYGTIE